MKLVLLPGLDGTGRLFGPLLDCLPTELEADVVAYPVDQSLDYDEITRFARSRLPTDQPFVVLGESFSSPVALRLASAGLPALRGVVLSCGFARNPRPGLAPLAALLPAVPIRGRLSEAVRNLLLGIHDRELREQAEAALSSVKPDVIRHRLKAVAGLDARRALSRVDVPILYLQASDDRLVPDASANEIRRIAPGVEVVRFAGPHMLLQVQPGLCANAIQAFLAKC